MSNQDLKERVRAFWQANPCGVKFADAAPGTRRFYELGGWRLDGATKSDAREGFTLQEVRYRLALDP